MVAWVLVHGVALMYLMVLHRCTGSWWWRDIGALDPSGGVALVHWILVVAGHWCTGSWWWRGICALDPSGGVALVHWILVVA